MIDLASLLKGRTILVVEDDALIAMGLVSYLEALGGTALWATNIARSRSFIESCEKIDVAIVDFNLNGELSIPILDQLIKQNVYTILCTGYDADSIELRFRGLPRSEKPFTCAKIRSLVISGL